MGVGLCHSLLCCALCLASETTRYVSNPHLSEDAVLSPNRSIQHARKRTLRCREQ